MYAADHIVDIGPERWDLNGGELVAQGTRGGYYATASESHYRCSIVWRRKGRSRYLQSVGERANGKQH